MPSKYRAFKEAADTIESLSAQVAAEHARAERAEQQLAERDAELAALKGNAEELIRRLGGIANWREEAHKYDADMDNEPRTFCEDVELIEQAAQDAIEAYRRDYPEES